MEGIVTFAQNATRIYRLEESLNFVTDYDVLLATHNRRSREKDRIGLISDFQMAVI